MNTNLIKVKRGESRLETMNRRTQDVRRLRMKHITYHVEGYHIRIALNGKMHSDWRAFRHYSTKEECLDAAVERRDEMLKELGKPLSLKSVQPGGIGLRKDTSSSNTGYRGLYYREYSYFKRGVKQFTKVIDIRWWSASLDKWCHTKVAVKKEGGRGKAIKAALRRQKELERQYA